AASSWLFCSASLNAATMRSWSISTSSGFTTEASSVTDFTRCWPVMTTLTAPPPAVASTVCSPSSFWILSICACICCRSLGLPILGVRPPGWIRPLYEWPERAVEEARSVHQLDDRPGVQPERAPHQRVLHHALQRRPLRRPAHDAGELPARAGHVEDDVF